MARAISAYVATEPSGMRRVTPYTMLDKFMRLSDDFPNILILYGSESFLMGEPAKAVVLVRNLNLPFLRLSQRIDDNLESGIALTLLAGGPTLASMSCRDAVNKKTIRRAEPGQNPEVACSKAGLLGDLPE